MLSDPFAVNRVAWRLYQEALHENMEPMGAAGDDIFAEYEATSSALHRSVKSLVGKAEIGDTVYTPNGEMIVADVGAGSLILTQDGRSVSANGWDEDPGNTVVFYEVYTEAGRVAHGWVNAESRKLVQAG